MEEVNLAKTFILNFEEYFDLPKGLGWLEKQKKFISGKSLKPFVCNSECKKEEINCINYFLKLFLLFSINYVFYALANKNLVDFMTWKVVLISKNISLV